MAYYMPYHKEISSDNIYGKNYSVTNLLFSTTVVRTYRVSHTEMRTKNWPLVHRYLTSPFMGCTGAASISKK